MDSNQSVLIGNYRIYQTDYVGEMWICKEDSGEGFAVDKEKFEAAIAKFYKDNF